MNPSRSSAARWLATLRAVLVLSAAAVAHSAPQVVTVCGQDNAPGGLNLAAAIASGGQIVIRCPAGQDAITLTGTLNVTRSVSLDGEGKVTLRGPVAGPLFKVATAMSLSRLTVENPRTNATAGTPGAGAIVIGPSATIELDDVTTQNSLGAYTAKSFHAQNSRFLHNEWYGHNGRSNGTFNWTSAMRVGSQWNFKQVFSGGDGVIYAIKNNGDLMWYRHDGRNDGTFRWASNEGRKVGSGWNVKQVFAAGGGVIYAIKNNGDLMWYRHDGRGDGSFRWASNEGKKVGSDWNVKDVFAGDSGVIYAVKDNGDLMWYRHDGRGDGSFRWASNEGKKVGSGWNFVRSFSSGDGIIYGIRGDGALMWYRHDGRNNGTFRWLSNQGRQVGSGWNGALPVFSGAALAP